MSVESYIKKNITGIAKNAYAAPDIPFKKLANAMKYIDLNELNEEQISIYGIIDTTSFNSTKEVWIFAEDSMYYKTALSESEKCLYENISEAKELNGDLYIYFDNKADLKVSKNALFNIKVEKLVKFILDIKKIANEASEIPVLIMKGL